MSSTGERQPGLSHEQAKSRLSVSLTGSSARYLEDFAQRHPDAGSLARILGHALSLVKLSEDLGPNETLSVVDSETGTNRPVVLPWREDSSRIQLPSL